MSDEKTDARPEDQAGLAKNDAQAPDPAAQASAELTALVAENSDMRDRLLRTMADMENLRRRTEREKADTSRYAISNFARDVLTVGDNLRRTIEHVPADAAAQDPALKSFLDGVELTERELLNVLERHGVTRIDPVGQRFDPNCHQAMYEVQNPDVPEGYRCCIRSPLAHFINGFPMAHPFQVRRDDQTDDPMMFFLRVLCGKNKIEIGISPIGNPHLRTIKNIVIPIADGNGSHRGRI